MPARCRTLAPLEQVGRNFVLEQGGARRLSYFAGCDYYRLSSHPAVRQALCAGLESLGLSVCASRRTTGNHPVYAEFERELARWFGAPSALLLASGYMTNLAVAQALAGDVSHVLIDERAHSSLADGARFFDCPVVRFPHRNATRAAAAAQRCGRSARLILLTDGLFAHSGEVAPLHDYLRLLPAGARLLVDDAHGAGVLGRRGRGTAEHLRVPARRLIRTVSLGKALGVGGGAVLGPAALCRRIIERSRLFAGHTPLALPLVAAARASLRLLSEDFRMRRRLVLNTGSVKAALRAAGFPVPDGPGPIIAFRAGSRREAALLAGRLRAAGVHPPLIQYPGGPAEGYFRFVISSEHTAEQLDTLVDVLLAPPRIRALPG